MWPPYGSQGALEGGHDSFLLLKVSEFIGFHQHFSQEYGALDDFSRIHEIYAEQLAKLRKRTLREMQALSQSITEVTQDDTSITPRVKRVQYEEKQISINENGIETIQLVGGTPEHSDSDELWDDDMKEGQVPEANASAFNSAVQLIEPDEVFRPYSFEPAP